jgi:hypothetical protein
VFQLNVIYIATRHCNVSIESLNPATALQDCRLLNLNETPFSMKRMHVNHFKHGCHCDIKAEHFTTSGFLYKQLRRDSCISRVLALR